jgi:endoglucanase
MTLRVKLHSLFVSMLVVAVVLSSGAWPTGVAHAISTPWLSVSGRFIKDPQGNNVVLRGVSLIDISVADTRPRNAVALTNMLTNAADGWYARVVRFPVYPHTVDGQPGWLANPDNYFNNHLNPAIQNCIARQIYCIVDWHYLADYTSSQIDAQTRAFWTYVAPKYANTPNVIFELFTEPILPDNWSTWKTTAQPWVDLIRSIAPRNLILIGGPLWSSNMAGAASDPFVGSNLVYSAHIYPQHGNQTNWNALFGNAANSVPFFVSEWGWQKNSGNPTNGTLSGYGIPFTTYIESKGLSSTAWVFDMYWRPVMFDESYNLLGGENFMGQFMKDFLFQHRNDNLPGTFTVSLVSPSGAINTNNPTYTWNAVADATWYYLWVNGPSGNVLKQWFSATDVCGQSTCSATAAKILGAGAHTWYIRPWSDSAGYGLWSTGLTFTVTPPPLPGAASLVSPTGAVTDTTPDFTWNAVSGATSYFLWVKAPSGDGFIKHWFNPTQAGCPSGSGTCTVTSPKTLAAGSHSWWIRTWNSAGYGPWSSGLTFTVSLPPKPGATTLIAPNSSTTDTTPTYSWNAVSGADWYYLWVSNPSGTAVIKQWFQASTACSGGTCTATPATGLGLGTHRWWVQTYNAAGYGPWSSGLNFNVTP